MPHFLKCYFVILLLFPQLAKAQKNNSSLNFGSGKIVYTAQVAINTPSNSIDTLKFNRESSIFLWQLNEKENSKEMKEIKNKYPSARLIYSSNADGIYRSNYYNVKKDSLYSRFYLLNQLYLLKEKNPHIQWSIKNRSKKIGNYLCTMATSHFRGRDYIVWFTTEIPVPYGPWKLVGLPGLVLQAYDSQREINFKAQKIMFGNTKSAISMPLNGSEEVITLDNYKKIMTHLRKKMVQNAQKVVRKYRDKNPDASFDFKIPEQKPMEIFSKK